MSFKELKSRVDNQPPKIKTGWLRDQVIDLTHITSVREQWDSMDGKAIRGFYIEGSLSGPISLGDNESLIVLSRELSKEWRRFVYTKELMHAFDRKNERTDSAEKFDAQVRRFDDPGADTPPQFRSETKAFWRALAALCPEPYWVEMKKQVEDKTISVASVAARLKIPIRNAEDLFWDEYPRILAHVMQD